MVSARYIFAPYAPSLNDRMAQQVSTFAYRSKGRRFESSRRHWFLHTLSYSLPPTRMVPTSRASNLPRPRLTGWLTVVAVTEANYRTNDELIVLSVADILGLFAPGPFKTEISQRQATPNVSKQPMSKCSEQYSCFDFALTQRCCSLSNLP